MYHLSGLQVTPGPSLGGAASPVVNQSMQTLNMSHIAITASSGERNFLN
jgi:hypothetical protein